MNGLDKEGAGSPSGVSIPGWGTLLGAHFLGRTGSAFPPLLAEAPFLWRVRLTRLPWVGADEDSLEKVHGAARTHPCLHPSPSIPHPCLHPSLSWARKFLRDMLHSTLWQEGSHRRQCLREGCESRRWSGMPQLQLLPPPGIPTQRASTPQP